MRLAVVASHPIQYQAPWFRALADVLDVEVLYCHRQDGDGQAAAGFGHAFDWDIPLFDGYRFRWLNNVASRPGVDNFSGCDTPEVGAVLDAGEFDGCLVNGWYLKSYLQAIQACRQKRIPVIVRGDSQLKTPRPRLKQVAKYWPYRWLLSQIDAHLYVGRANYSYVRHYGVESRRLFFAPHFVDGDRFARGAALARASGAVAALRASLGVRDADVVFLFAGKLIEKKRPLDFVEAVGRLRAEGAPVHGLIVGSGPLEDDLRRHVSRRSSPVHFLGFRNQSQVPVCYAAADCLVLPSDGRETWGLVVNEAMSCGLPAIVSDAIGCMEDMVTDGETGFSYPCGDIRALCDRMRRIVGASAQARQQFAAAVENRVAQYSCARAVAGTIEALRFSISEHDNRRREIALGSHT